jgi:hypothetical protein
MVNSNPHVFIPIDQNSEDGFIFRVEDITSVMSLAAGYTRIIADVDGHIHVVHTVITSKEIYYLIKEAQRTA